MNEYKYCDLEVGQKESFSVVITEDMVRSFFSITNDCNPLHHEKNFAIERGFSDKVVFGMLTASFISTLAGVYLPGKYCIIHSTECKFLRPVYIDDCLEISGIVQEKHDSVQQVDIKVIITNQNSQKVLKGTLKVGILNE